MEYPAALQKRARRCLECPLCSRARARQGGLAYFFTRYIDRKICPNCKAFERLTGQRAYEPLSEETRVKITGNQQT